MSKFFVPYHGDTPATIDVKGHRILVVWTQDDDLEADLDRFGADQIKELESATEDNEMLAGLANEIRGGVVLAPPGIDATTMLESLSRDLPWVH